MISPGTPKTRRRVEREIWNGLHIRTLGACTIPRFSIASHPRPDRHERDICLACPRKHNSLYGDDPNTHARETREGFAPSTEGAGTAVDDARIGNVLHMHQEHDGESLTTSTPHWREYPIGAVGEGAQSTLRILAPFGVGIVFTFLLVLVVGITYEEDAIFNALLNLGVTYNDWEPISDLLDYATRMSAFPMLLLAYAIGLAAAVAMCIRDIATSKALVKAARSEEPRIAVPSPAQVESVIKKRFNGLWLLSIYTAGALALFAIIMIIVATTEGYSDFSSIGFLTLGVAALFGALVWFMSAVLHPAHHRRRLIICEWWTTEDEKQAWAAARASARGSEKTTSNSTRVERDPRTDRGAKIVKYAGFLFAASIIAIFAIMFVLYPNGSQFHGAGERINLSPGFESLLTIALLVILACATV